MFKKEAIILTLLIMLPIVIGIIAAHHIAHSQYQITTENAKEIEETNIKSQILTADSAATIAANLANEKCNKTFGRTPFTAKSYNPIIKENKWYWGGLDPAGIKGFSAEVSFEKDGSNPNVEVYFSQDAEMPPKEAISQATEEF